MLMPNIISNMFNIFVAFPDHVHKTNLILHYTPHPPREPYTQTPDEPDDNFVPET